LIEKKESTTYLSKRKIINNEIKAINAHKSRERESMNGNSYRREERN
jgi:hypothetical protein